MLVELLHTEGGTRTRTARRANGFSYHYDFRRPSRLTVCGLDDAFSVRFAERLGGSRLVSTLCRLVQDSLSSALPSARTVKGSPTLTPFTSGFPLLTCSNIQVRCVYH